MRAGGPSFRFRRWATADRRARRFMTAMPRRRSSGFDGLRLSAGAGVGGVARRGGGRFGNDARGGQQIRTGRNRRKNGRRPDEGGEGSFRGPPLGGEVPSAARR